MSVDAVPACDPGGFGRRACCSYVRLVLPVPDGPLAPVHPFGPGLHLALALGLRCF